MADGADRGDRGREDGHLPPTDREAIAAIERHAEARRQLHRLRRELQRLRRVPNPPEVIAEASQRVRVAEAVERLAREEAERDFSPARDRKRHGEEAEPEE